MTNPIGPGNLFFHAKMAGTLELMKELETFRDRLRVHVATKSCELCSGKHGPSHYCKSCQNIFDLIVSLNSQIRHIREDIISKYPGGISNVNPSEVESYLSEMGAIGYDRNR